MTWVPFITAAIAGLASMRAAMERGDVDEAARQGTLAGPHIIEVALASPDRPTRLAAIAAAPAAEDRAELLDALARAAAGPDRRTAIPAARAAKAIALELAQHDLPDDLAPADAREWRDAWAALALRTDRWIELRILALDTSAFLDRAAASLGGTPGIGVALDAALADRDPAFRRAAILAVPSPLPPAMQAPLAAALATDASPDVATAAAQVLCVEGATIDAAGKERIKALGVKRCAVK